MRVSQNRVLSKIFGPNRDEGTQRWRQLHEENLYTHFQILSANEIRECEPRGVCCMHGTKKKCIHSFGWETWREETIHIRHLRNAGRQILKLIFQKQDFSTNKLQALVNNVMNIQLP
jgi:hypothetical protein